MTSTQSLRPHEVRIYLEKLNDNLRIACGNNDSRLAGVWLRERDGLGAEDICGVDKNYVPAYPSFDSSGHITTSGWRRVTWILLTHGYTTKEKIRRVCPGFFDSRACLADRFTGGETGDPIDNRILRYTNDAPIKRWRNPDTGAIEEGSVLTLEQYLDVQEEIRKRDTPVQQETRNRDIWFLERWKKNGGGPKDRPNY